MTDLNTKIADVRREAEAYRSIPVMSQDYWRASEQWRKTSRYLLPSLIIAWAEERDRDKARIEELEKALKPFAKASDELIPGTPDEAGVMWDGIVALANAGHLRSASRALNGEKL